MLPYVINFYIILIAEDKSILKINPSHGCKLRNLINHLSLEVDVNRILLQIMP